MALENRILTGGIAYEGALVDVATESCAADLKGSQEAPNVVAETQIELIKSFRVVFKRTDEKYGPRSRDRPGLYIAHLHANAPAALP